MPFAAATAPAVGHYLGYPASEASAQRILSTLAEIEAMPTTAYANAAILSIEGYLSQLDAIATAINTERAMEGSTLLPELRREYRRYCALLSNALALEAYIDTSGASLT